jgi:FMN phosphatase YigB (HAD superfamily)
MVRAVFFDIGETLVNETRAWTRAAERLGVPPLTLFGVLGGLIERREPHVGVLDLLGIERSSWSWPGYGPDDFYPDAFPCLRALREDGYVLGLVGNQPESCETFLRDAQLDVDCIASSASWGVAKPSLEFFRRVIETAGCAPHEVAYVGDRVDNDVVPAADAGMVAVFIRRGPWGYLQASWPETARAHIRLDSLAELPEALRRD